MRIPGTLNVALTMTVAAACCGALWLASHGTPWLIAAAVVAFSLVGNTMFSLLHESVHGIAHERERVNEAVGIMAAVFFPTALSLQRVFHLGHHAHNRTAQEQFDYIGPHDRPWLKRAQWYAILTGVYWLFVPLGGLAYLLAPSLFTRLGTRGSGGVAVQTGASSMFAGLERAPRTRIRLELLFTLAAQVALATALDLTFAGWALCYAAFALNWSSLQYTDHAFSKLDVRDGAWNLRVNAFTRLIFLNYHHHLAHHQHSQVPWIHLGRYVDPDEARPSFWSIYWRMWRGPQPLPLGAQASRLQDRRASRPTRARERGRISPSRQCAGRGETPRDPAAGTAALLVDLPFCILFAIVFAVCYGGAAWWTGRYTTLPAWNFGFESAVPFVPGASLIYLTITPALMLAPLILRKRRALAPFAITLCVETVIAAVCFLAVPLTTAFVRPEVTGWAAVPFRIADTINLQYNEFPSLHVAFAFSAAWAYRGWKWMVWAALVALSTWLMWEHHLTGIAGGLALAAVAMRFVYPRLQKPGVELQCLWQCMRFSRRHVRYFVIFLAIYLPSLRHWRRYRAVRTGFCAAQWIDDLLDGDRPSRREPLEIVDGLLAEMTAGTFADGPLSQVTAALFAEMDDASRTAFIELVRTMRVDRVRVLERAVWTAERLSEHHRNTFSLSVDLLLATSGCQARAAAVPSLVEALAWCSVFRDLDDDLRKGLNNIPLFAERESWTRTSHARACLSLESAAREIAALDDPRARRLLGIFQRSVAKFAVRTRSGRSIPVRDPAPES
jgi:fatty acid desaturase